MYDTILVATDGSESSTAAVEQGVAIADGHDATVRFLHVVDVGTEMSAAGVGTVAEELTQSLLGSTADRVARTVDASVLLARP